MMRVKENSEYKKMQNDFENLKKKNDYRRLRFQSDIAKKRKEFSEMEKSTNERLNKFIPGRNKSR